MIPTLKFKSYFDSRGLKRAFNEASLSPMQEAGKTVQREAKKSMRPARRATKKKKLPWLKRPIGKGQFIPSKPGKPPRRRTGRMARNVTSFVKRAILFPRVFVMSRRDFGHEKGLAGKAARPYLMPALEKVKKKFAGLWRGISLAKTKAGIKLNRRRSFKR